MVKGEISPKHNNNTWNLGEAYATIYKNQFFILCFNISNFIDLFCKEKMDMPN